MFSSYGKIIVVFHDHEIEADPLVPLQDGAHRLVWDLPVKMTCLKEF